MSDQYLLDDREDEEVPPDPESEPIGGAVFRDHTHEEIVALWASAIDKYLQEADSGLPGVPRPDHTVEVYADNEYTGYLDEDYEDDWRERWSQTSRASG